MTTAHASTVGPMLRSWRSSRGKSQLALAVEAGVSTRHLSFVETGRSSPSREMVLTLAEHLDVPLRDRNRLLEAAGYAAVFRETPLDAAPMSEVRVALSHILDASEPNPTLVVNRRYDVLLANAAAVELLSFFAPAWKGKNNVARLLFSSEGLRPNVVDWPVVAGHVIRRLRAELSSGTRDARDDEILELAIAAQSDLAEHTSEAARPPSILVPVTFRRGDVVIDLFTTITTLGTPLDITLQELRIETLFAANPESRRALATVVGRTTD
jgi:transcriptional regulator with XRE-family HTH domain